MASKHTTQRKPRSGTATTCSIGAGSPQKRQRAGGLTLGFACEGESRSAAPDPACSLRCAAWRTRRPVLGEPPARFGLRDDREDLDGLTRDVMKYPHFPRQKG